MSEEERVLFSQRYYLRNDLTNNNEDFFDMILNIILNSKEIKNTPLKISDSNTYSEILGLIVTPVSNLTFNCSFSLIYTVYDVMTHENRTMNGILIFNSLNSALIIANISRFNEYGYIGSCEYVDSISKDGLRYYDYGSTPYCGEEQIFSSDISDVQDFKKGVVKLMRFRRK